MRGSVSDHTRRWEACARGRGGRRSPGRASEESVVAEGSEGEGGAAGGEGRMEVWREDGWRGWYGRGGGGLCAWSNLTVLLGGGGGGGASCAMAGGRGAGGGGVCAAAWGEGSALAGTGAGAAAAMAVAGGGATSRTASVQCE